MDQSSTNATDQTSNQDQTQGLDPKEAFNLFSQDPVGFIHEIMSGMADYHLGSLKEQVELQSALLIARKTLPNFSQFEPYILQELGELIASDKDGVLEPWPTLIDQAMEKFRQRFAQIAKEDPATAKALVAQTQTEGPSATVAMESPSMRRPQPASQQFSRQEIGKMSLEQFMANEGAINQALKERRIQ